MADQITQKKSKEKNESSKKQGLGKPVKYLFDNHLFDTPYDEPEEESQEKKDEPPPPPPPTYNEEELNAAVEKARAEGKEEGRQEAFQESAESLEQSTKTTLDTLAAQISNLALAEGARNEAFERDALQMSYCVFKKLFPYYADREGLNEIEEFIKTLILKQDTKAEMNILVSPKLAEKISKSVAAHPSLGDYLIYVKGAESLEEGDARIEWDNGGATRELSTLQKQIDEIMSKQLASGPNNTHNEVETDDKSSSSPDKADTEKSGKDGPEQKPDNPEAGKDLKKEKPDKPDKPDN